MVKLIIQIHHQFVIIGGKQFSALTIKRSDFINYYNDTSMDSNT